MGQTHGWRCSRFVLWGQGGVPRTPRKIGCRLHSRQSAGHFRRMAILTTVRLRPMVSAGCAFVALKQAGLPVIDARCRPWIDIGRSSPTDAAGRFVSARHRSIVPDAAFVIILTWQRARERPVKRRFSAAGAVTDYRIDPILECPTASRIRPRHSLAPGAFSCPPFVTIPVFL